MTALARVTYLARKKQREKRAREKERDRQRERERENRKLCEQENTNFPLERMLSRYMVRVALMRLNLYICSHRSLLSGIGGIAGNTCTLRFSRNDLGPRSGRWTKDEEQKGAEGSGRVTRDRRFRGRGRREKAKQAR